VGTSTRSPQLPDVPSIVDAGLPDAAYTFWVGLFAPAGTPKPVEQKLHAAVIKALDMPDIRTRLEGLGAAPMPMEQAAFQKYLVQETATAAQLVQAAGIKVE